MKCFTDAELVLYEQRVAREAFSKITVPVVLVAIEAGINGTHDYTRSAEEVVATIQRLIPQ